MVEELENQGSNIGMLWDENLTAGNAEPVQWKYWNINLIELQSGQLIGAMLWFLAALHSPTTPVTMQFSLHQALSLTQKAHVPF